MKPLENDTLVRKALRAKDLPKSWNISIPGGPDTPILVVVKKEGQRKRPLASYIGAVSGVYESAQEVDKHIRQLRNE